MIKFLEQTRRYARGESGLPEIAEAARDHWRRSIWPEVARMSGQARALQAEIHTFQQRHRQSRVVVTPLLVLACVGIYLLMLVRGVSPFEPSIPSMIEWGANFGPSLAYDHQPWRLMTNVFLHFGLIHLALNMWCLIGAGPTVERFYGNLSFAALYLLAGLGGSVASTWAASDVRCRRGGLAGARSSGSSVACWVTSSSAIAMCRRRS